MDDLFWAGTVHDRDTFFSDYAPAWRFVAKHAHFLPKVTNLATRYLEKTFGIENGSGVPPVSFVLFVASSKSPVLFLRN